MTAAALLAVTVQFASVTSSGPENVTPANIMLTLSASSAQTVTITYAVTGGSANFADYTLPNPKVVTFNPGEVEKPIAATLINDNLHEPTNEDVILILQFATNASVGQPAGHTFSIVDDDGTPVIQFAQATSSGTEATTPVSLQVVTSSTLPGYGITVDYAVTGGNAVNGSDYTLSPGTLTFFPNESSKTISFPVTSDGQEWDETVTVGLTNPTGGGSSVPVAIGGKALHTRTILGDGPSGCTAPTGGNCFPGGANPPLGIAWCCR